MQPKIGKTAIILAPPWSPLLAPLGICTVAEMFRLNGIECKEFDWNIELLTELENQFGEDFNRESELFWDPVYVSPFWQNFDFFKTDIGLKISDWLTNRLNNLISEGYTTFGFSVFESNTNISRYLITLLRQLQPNALILMGGPATNNIIEYKYNNQWLSKIDFIFYKEAEETLPSFIKESGKTENETEILGTAVVKPVTLLKLQFYKRIVKRLLGCKINNNYSLTYTPYNQPTNLANIPSINFDHIDLKKYKTEAIPLEFSRGCSGACSFCSETLRYKPYRGRPVEHLICDFKIAIAKYNAQYICLVCSALNGNRKHLGDFCEALISDNIKVQWGGNARLDRTLDAEILTMMSKAGCHDLDFGLESGSDHVLNLMNKRSDVKTASEIIRICNELNIELAVNLIVGFPGETEEDLNETIDFINNHYRMVSIFNVSKCYLDGYAPLGKNPEKFGILTHNGKAVAVDPDYSKPGTIPPVVPGGPHWSDWSTTDGQNTPYIRNQRYQKVLLLIDKLGKRGNTPHDSKKSNDLTYHN